MNDPAEIRGKVLHGLRWTGGVRLVTQVVSWAITILVIRFLHPEDYGLAAMSTVTFYLFMLLTTGGIEQAIVQTKKLEQNQIPSIFGILLVFNVGLGLVQLGLAPVLAAFYKEPRVIPIVATMACGFPLVPLISIPLAILCRDLDFKRRSLSDMTKAAAASVVTLLLAVLGFGVWALILGQLVGLVAQACFLNVVVRWLCIPRFMLRGVERLVRFGGIVAVTNVIWMFSFQVDAILGGRILGPEFLGLYAVALRLASLPMEKIMPLLHQIAFPAYSRIQESVDEVAEYFLKAVRLVSLVTVPILFGIAAVAEQAIPLILGERWKNAALPVALLALSIPVRALDTMHQPLLIALGRTRVNLGNSLITVGVMAPAFLVGLQWGVLGACVTWLVAYPVVFFLLTGRMLRVLVLRPRSFAGAVLPAVVAGVSMLVILRLIAMFGLGDISPWWVMAVLIPSGAVIYLGILRVAYRDRLAEAINLARAFSFS